MQNGKITDVQALQLPGGQFRSQQIGQYAAPQLRSEVLAAQSANVNTISGATYTSEGYLQSVQSALDQAGALARSAIGIAEANGYGAQEVISMSPAGMVLSPMHDGTPPRSVGDAAAATTRPVPGITNPTWTGATIGGAAHRFDV